MRAGLGKIVPLLLAAVIFAAKPAEAVQQDDAQLPQDITMQEFQGLSCLVGGSLSSIATLGYTEIVASAAAAATGATVSVVAPLMATAFVAGCGVGAIISPGLLWIYHRFDYGQE
jgi:hypothetical protein